MIEERGWLDFVVVSVLLLMTGGSAMQLLVGMRALSKCDGQGCRGEQRERLIMSGCLRS